VVFALVVLFVVAGLTAGSAVHEPPKSEAGMPAAAETSGRAMVGPLFHGRDARGVHSCSASVVDSPSGDVLLTAAHCLSGRAIGWTFAPGFDDGATPYGIWHTTGAYLDPHWLHDQDPQFDYAVLTVASHRRAGRLMPLQQVVGGLEIGRPPILRPVRVTDIAYNSGVGGRAISCSTTLTWTQGYPTFDCAGFVGGSSGSPWITVGLDGRREVIGVTGGLHQGGCVDFISYASLFDSGVREMITRATYGEAADVAPVRDDDGC